MRHLELVPPVEPDTAEMPSRRLADGSTVYGLFEDRPPPYLTVVLIECDESVQGPERPAGEQ